MGHLGFNQMPMAEAEGGFSRDLLQRFISSGNNHFIRKYEDQEEEEAVELSLGLSLNGRFGVDPSANKKLIRSSSIPEFMTPVKKEEEELVCSEEQKAMMMMGTPLSRTCSLPVETEEQWRKRKELQSLRRMEAKRKRDEKQRNFRATRNRVSLEENCEEEKRIGDNGALPIDGKSKCMKVLNDFSLSVMPPVVVPNWGKERGFGGCGVEFNGEKSKSLVVGGVQGLPPLPPSSPPPLPAAPLSQGSIGSQGSGTSGISESESLPVQGPNKTAQARSLTSISSNPDQSDQKPGIEMSKMCAGDVLEDPSKNLTGPDKGNGEILRNMLLDMPCVSTKGCGPDGKRIEGFLYQYKKGEGVRIVCVCHGSFLSPAEFVKHAGGGDVEHPLKHIVVNSPSLL